MKRNQTVFALSTALALLGAGCSSSAANKSDSGAVGGSTSTTETVQLLSWWTGPGEADALQALTDTFKDQNPDAQVNLDSSVTPDNWSMVLSGGIDHSPWDAFQLAAADLPNFLVAHPNDVQAVDKYYAEPSLQASVIPQMEAQITISGHAYGVITGIHRNNSFLYNQQIFQANGIEPPTSIAEFMSAADTLKKAGVTPIATSFETWALRIMFDEILAGTLTAQGFDDFVQGRTPTTDPTLMTGIQSAIDSFGTILTEYIDVTKSSAPGYVWSNAAQDVHDGNAAIMLHGDWVKGYWMALGWTPGVDFGLSGPPGAGDLFVFGADMFGLPSTAPDPVAADAFLTVVASADGQVAFNRYKGATPMRTDVRDQLDDLGKASMDALLDAKVLSPSHANSAWDDAIATFAQDGDKAALLNVYVTTPP
jgi:glucose/mannose transport system substrate-binding protein